MKACFQPQTVLVLDASTIIGWQTCLILALHGFRIVGLSARADELQRLAREVADLHGAFTAIAVVPATDDQIAAIMHDICTQFRGVKMVINFLGVSRPAASICAAWARAMNAEALRLSQRSDAACPLAQVIEIQPWKPSDLALSDIENADWSQDPPWRWSHIELAQAPSIALPADCVWPLTGLANIPPGIIAAEVLNLLTEPAYQSVDAVALSVRGDEVWAHLTVSVLRVGQGNRISLEGARGKMAHVSIRQTRLGRGGFAEADFRRGELVIATRGQMLAHQTEHSLQIDWAQHVEPEFPTRVINHACEPNLGVCTNAVGLPDLIAFRDIRAGEELTFDYAMTEYTHYTHADLGLEFSLTCRCGSPACSGKLGYYAELPDDIKRKYAGYVADYLRRENT